MLCSEGLGARNRFETVRVQVRVGFGLHFHENRFDDFKAGFKPV